MHNKATAYGILEELSTIHVCSSKVREAKYQILLEKLKNFSMLPNELVEQIYSCLNVIIEDVNALNIRNLTLGDINWMIIHCHTRFQGQNQMHFICAPGSSSHTYDDLISE